MKKILSIQLVFILVVSIFISGFPLKAQALNDLEISTGGTTSKVSYTQSGSNEIIKIFSASAIITKQYILPPEGSVANYRLCFEIADSNVSKSIKFDVNKGTVKQVRLANSESKGTSVVVEMTKKPEYTLAPSSDKKSIVLTIKGTVSSSSPAPAPSVTPKPSTTPTPVTSTPKPTTTTKPSAQPSPAASAPATSVITKNGPLSVSMSGDICLITLNGISLSQTADGSVPRFELREKEKILQIVMPGNDTRFKTGYLSGNSVIYGILVNYNSKSNNTIIRISYVNSITFAHSIKNGSSEIQMKKGNTTIPQPPAPATPKPVPVTSTPTPPATSAPASNSNATFVFNASSVYVSSSAFSSANIYRLGNPSRIVIEFAGTAAAVEKIMPAGSLYTRAVVSQITANKVKAELYTNGIPEWSVSQKAGSFALALTKNALTNIEAGNMDGKVALRLVDSGIVSRYYKYAEDIILDDNVEKSTFTYRIPSSIVKIGDGTAKIENDLVESIISFSTQQSSYLLLYKQNPDTQFKLIPGSGPDELLIVVATSEGGGSKSKLVVLDPGHGGYDPGGTVGTNYEKNYNLDIALRAEAILKSKGINTALTRRTDIFVGLDARAEFANNLNATLFLSIHNNIMPSAYKGSMTLYYPSSYDGKAYARIIQNNMVDDLKTGDIGLKANGELVVVKKTAMPAVLAEVACMSYPDDLKLLNSEAFRQKAAESLARSIIEIFNSK